MTEIKQVFLDDIIDVFDIYRCGWSKKDLQDYEANYQTKFLGDSNDLGLEIITNNNQLFYVIFKAGESLKNQMQFILEETKFLLIINANGNIYRFDLIDRKLMSNDCYTTVLFDNTQDKGNISPYLATAVSPDSKIMIVIDEEGVAAINWEKVLWKRKFEWAYADYVRILTVSNSSVVLKIDPPNGSVKTVTLNIVTGMDS